MAKLGRLGEKPALGFLSEIVPLRCETVAAATDLDLIKVRKAIYGASDE